LNLPQNKFEKVSIEQPVDVDEQSVGTQINQDLQQSIVQEEQSPTTQIVNISVPKP